jgi:hypothetical protein
MMPLDELEKLEELRTFNARELEDLGQERAAAYQRTLNQAELIKKRNNGGDPSTDYAFEPGDMVKMKNHKQTKFQFSWKGPYHVVARGYPGTYFIMKPNGQQIETPVNQRDLAPWLAKTFDDQDYFFDGTKGQKDNQGLRLLEGDSVRSEPIYQATDSHEFLKIAVHQSESRQATMKDSISVY